MNKSFTTQAREIQSLKTSLFDHLCVPGNQDLCFYNFQCAVPVSGLYDFNHFFSNIGYVAFGLIFLILVR